jgi:hypothetical protein
MATTRKKKHTYPKENEDKMRDTIQKLRSQVRRLTKEVKELKSENSTLLDAWAKTEAFLHEVTEGVPLAEVMKHKTLPKKIIETKEPLCEKEAVRQKWANWRKDNL